MPENSLTFQNNDIEKDMFRERTWKDKSFFVILKQFSRNKLAMAGLIIVLLLILMGILAPVIAPYDYKAIDPIHANQAPSAEHLFGTDTVGRDILSRIFYGARTSLLIGVGSGLMGTIIGMILGIIAGYFGGIVETLILRMCDIVQSIPNMLLCIVVAQVFGRGLLPTMLALSMYSFPQIVRLMRASLLSLREQEFIEASRAMNCSNLRIMLCHLLPNSLSPVIVSFSMTIGMKIIASAGLAYLGLGVQEPTAEWGAMIAAGKAQLRFAPHIVIFPGIFVAIVVMAFNFIGDGLRDALDPKQRK